MRYLKKTKDSHILKDELMYASGSAGVNRLIKEYLLLEQAGHQVETDSGAVLIFGYCAYTEAYLNPTDASDVEHFDDSLKGTSQDDYWNWYAVSRWVNSHKPRIVSKKSNFLPIITPHSVDLTTRIKYEDGQFDPIKEDDIEATNLIKFLGWNNPTLAGTRNTFIRRKRDELEQFFDGDLVAFRKYLLAYPSNLSFRTVLEAEFGLLEDSI